MNRNLNIFIDKSQLNAEDEDNNENDKEIDDDEDDDSSSKKASNSNNNNTRGLVGLRNLGNTCYLNAALQALSNCPSITNFFLECQYYVKYDKIPCLSQHYMKLIHSMWSTSELNTSIAPIELVQTIKYVNPMFKGYSQQDSQEFLLTMLDQLHEELKHVHLNSSLSSTNEINYEIKTTTTTRTTNSSSNEEDTAMNVSSQSDTDSFKSCGSSPGSSPSSDFLSNYETTVNGDGPTILFSNERKQYRSISNSHESSSSQPIDSSKFKQLNNKSSENELILNPNYLLENNSDKSLNKKKQKKTENEESEDEKKIQNCNNNKNSSKKANNKDKKVYTSIISDVFDGKMIGQVQCTGCETISNTVETFQDLSLPIPTKEYLQVLLLVLRFEFCRLTFLLVFRH